MAAMFETGQLQTPLNDHLWWAAALSIAATNLGPNCIAIQNST